MRGFGRFDAGTGRAGYSGDMHGVVQQSCGGKRQQAQLDRRREAAGIGDFGSLLDLVPLPFRKAIDIAFGLVPVVLGQVNDFQVPGTGMFRPECAASAVPSAEEKHVDVCEVVFAAEYQIRIAEQSAVNMMYGRACVALRVDKSDLDGRVEDQQTKQFTSCIAGAADDADADHKESSSSG